MVGALEAEARKRPASTRLVLVAPAYLEVLRPLLSGLDCEVDVLGEGQELLEAVRRRAPDLLLVAPDVPGVDGFELCAAVKRAPASRRVPVVMVAARAEPEAHRRALEAGADDVLTRPINHVELRARVRSLLLLKAMYEGLEDRDRVIFALAETVAARDGYPAAHCERVALTARALGERVGLRPAELDLLYTGGYLHDLGKLAVPDAVLQKRGRLTAAELELARSHAALGETIVRPLRTAAAVREIVRHHHERPDGRGYPDRLEGQAIPLPALVVSVCDAYEAMVSDRPYRPALSPAEALRTLRRGAGTRWDAELVELFSEQVAPLHRRLMRAG